MKKAEKALALSSSMVHLGIQAIIKILHKNLFLHLPFTLWDRRGRNGSGEKGSANSIEKECEDVEAIIQKESVFFIFGHSFGGLVALEAGLQFPSIHKIAVYEPPISINGSVPTAWLPLFVVQLREGDFVGASFSFFKVLHIGGLWSWLQYYTLSIHVK